MNAVQSPALLAPFPSHTVDATPASRARRRDHGARLVRAASAVLDAGAGAISVQAAFERRFGGHRDESATRDVVEALTRGVQSPAATDVPEWAGAMVATTLVALVDLLGEQDSVVAQLPLVRYSFDGRGILGVPMRAAGTPNLAGTFRKEGMPIRVGALSLVRATLKAKTMGIIATSSAEMAGAAGDDVVEQVIRQGILTDTTRALDGVFLDDVPADDVRPPGMGSLATGDNTAAASGTDAESIAADLRARYDQLLANGFGNPSTTRWVMNSANAATMVELFPEVQQRDTYLRVPIVASPSVPLDVVYLIDCSAVAFGADSPRFDASGDAVLHEEGDQTLVAPIDTASPVRSLYQSYVLGFRATWMLDWAAANGAVQTVTDVAW